MVGELLERLADDVTSGGPTAQVLAAWIDANGYRADGYAREINLECPENRDDWVTELQVPVTEI